MLILLMLTFLFHTLQKHLANIKSHNIKLRDSLVVSPNTEP